MDSHLFIVFLEIKRKEREKNKSLSKRRKYLDLDLDILSSFFTIAVLSVFSVGFTGLCFLQLALDIVCRSRSRSSLFNIRSYRFL
jgi:hypothetical protein